MSSLFKITAEVFGLRFEVPSTLSLLLTLFGMLLRLSIGDTVLFVDGVGSVVLIVGNVDAVEVDFVDVVEVVDVCVLDVVCVVDLVVLDVVCVVEVDWVVLVSVDD